MLKTRPRFLLMAYAVVLSIEAGANIAINFLGKGRTWDLYPLAELFWVACSVMVVIVMARRAREARGGSMKRSARLAWVVIALMFLDSLVDACAMGHANWWASPPVLIEWKWDALRARGVLYHWLYAYWAVTWGMQVPLRCFAIAWVLCGSTALTTGGGEGGSWRRFGFIAAGLNLIWVTAPQDFLFFFVWQGLYDLRYPYFDYLPPEGMWNLWNMLLLRVPIGVGAGILLVWAGRERGVTLRTTGAAPYTIQSDAAMGP